MVHIVIDGYNYINRVRSSPVLDSASLEMLRGALLEKLARYKRRQGNRITVVFDAQESRWPSRHRESHKGIDVVYSKEHETADDVIIGWVREKPAGIVVVSSDRAIIDEAKRAGVPFMTPPKMEEAMASCKEYDKDEEEESVTASTKRGNPRKLPKKLRKAARSLHKIKS
ncbi:NYN domain-containing protein [Syntrophorhabdus aromaticivorans]|uniref:NYN domain-containing protein n=1 Tax=Syntrophorhabdus aromaticivorans TaxID=328301 RepID=A0A971S0D8_9BACT|nr:NYN domain-containing protein [Syntrophorhabdus aromaticivorans]NLW35240.1 NYN domain-containing protein [Syntrophorhabdus aromaticivorans]